MKRGQVKQSLTKQGIPHSMFRLLPRFSMRFQPGFITSYILYGIALLAAISAAVAAFTNRNAEQKIAEQAREELIAQSNMIRNKLLMCSLQRSSSASLSDSVVTDFPRPSANLAVTTVDLKKVNCVDAADPSGDNFGSLWTMGDGITLPKTPPGFNPWRYTNTGANVYVSINYAGTPDAKSAAIIDTVVRKLGTGMADIQGQGTLLVYVKRS